MDIFFKPRIGTHYTEGWQGIRTLVLGAHHICSFDCQMKHLCCQADKVWEMDDHCPCYVSLRDSEYHKLHNNNIVEMDAYIDDLANFPTYSAFTKYMLGRKDYLTEDDRADFWEHVVFYNFLQHFLPNGNTPPYQGNEAMYDAAIPALTEMIASLPEPPQVIYVWSKAVRDCLLNNINKVEGLRAESLDEYPQVMELYFFSLNYNVAYSREWVEEYIHARLEPGSFAEELQFRPSVSEVLYRALCDGFLRAQDGEIVMPYNSAKHSTAEYGKFLQILYRDYHFRWKGIESIIFKLDKHGNHQKQNLRGLNILDKTDPAYEYINAFFKL